MANSHGPLGRILLSVSPWTYKKAVGVLSKILLSFQNRGAFITDSLGGSFKTYIEQHGRDGLVNELVEGLDDRSRSELEVVIQRLIDIPDHQVFLRNNPKYRIINNRPRVKELLEVETTESKTNIDRFLKDKAVQLIGGNKEPSVWYFDHGLKFVPHGVIQYIRNKDFIDIGSYIGDSALALSKYDFSHIHSFDISAISIKLYIRNMELNGIPHQRFTINHCAISDTIGEKMVISDTGSPGLALVRGGGKGEELEIFTDTLDHYCTERSINPSLIKVDMEGYAMQFVKGALTTIIKSRPVLLIAIYHNPVEFFEIKPLLQKKLDNYTFQLRKLSAEVKRNECHSEMFLIGYPNEVV